MKSIFSKDESLYLIQKIWEESDFIQMFMLVTSMEVKFQYVMVGTGIGPDPVGAEVFEHPDN